MIKDIMMMVENPAFRIFFGIVAAIFILGIITRFGFSSYNAVCYGVYDIMMLVFILAIAVAASGPSGQQTKDSTAQLFSGILGKLGPLYDQFDLYEKSSSGFVNLFGAAGNIFCLK